MLISKTVDIKIVNANRKHYESLGYKNIKNGDIINVPIEKLQPQSHALVLCNCDYCDEKVEMEYRNYLKRINEIVDKIACKKCSGKKERECNLIKYGVPSPMCLKSVQEKAKQTTMMHYGVENPSQSPEIKEKVRQSFIEHYGVDHVSKLPEFQQRVQETRIEKYGVPHIFQNDEYKERYRLAVLEKYGVENISQSEEIKQKKKDTTMKHYGVEYGSQSPIIKEKIAKTLYNNKTTPTSHQQKYINNLYNMTLNYPIGHFNVDMCDIDNKIVCEYDGGGHRLSVKMGDLSEEEFNQKEIVRNSIIKRQGYKIFRIISVRDRLPSDEVLLKILNESKEYFYKYPNHSWIEFDIDNNCLRNAENKTGVPFNFGKLKNTY